MRLEEYENILNYLLDDNNYKNIIEFLLDKQEQGIDLHRIVKIRDDVYHTMYLDEKNRRNNIKTLAKEKQALMDI